MIIPNDIRALYKHYGTGEASPRAFYPILLPIQIGESGKTQFKHYSADRAGIVKVYEAVTQYCDQMLKQEKPVYLKEK